MVFSVSKEWLLSEYVQKNRTITDICHELNVSNVTLKKKIREHGIPLRTQAIDLTPHNDALHDLHFNQHMTLKDLAPLYGVSHSKMHTHFIKQGWEAADFQKKDIPPESELRALYEEGMTFAALGKRYGTSNVTVRSWFKQYGIPVRSHQETQKMNMARKRTTQAQFIEQCHEVHANKYDYSRIDNFERAGGDTKVEIVCPEHGSFFQRTTHHLMLENGCPRCGKQLSHAEDEIAAFLTANGIEHVQSYRNGLSGQFEIDLFLPAHKIGIEYNGIYWHSEKFKHRNYHAEKTNKAAENGITLYHVFENEWMQTPDIWKSLLLAKMGKTPNTLGARECVVKPVAVAETRAFLEENHLQGYAAASVRLGLYCDDILVSLMTFGKSRYNKDHGWEIIRFANRAYHGVVGGASKLFSAFVKEHNPVSVVSYSDRRISTGGLYKALNFVKTHTTAPNYFYFKGKSCQLESRIKYQKHKLVKMLPNFNQNRSEYENMLAHGYNRIWDCGNDVWVWSRA